MAQFTKIVLGGFIQKLGVCPCFNKNLGHVGTVSIPTAPLIMLSIQVLPPAASQLFYPTCTCCLSIASGSHGHSTAAERCKVSRVILGTVTEEEEAMRLGKKMEGIHEWR